VKAWLAQRLLHRAWAATQAEGVPVEPWPWADTWPIARLSMPDRGIDLIVLADASGRSMAFGPGLVAGTAPPGVPGNTVLSGHRDTQFRFLRSLEPGARLRVEDARGAWHNYAVSDALIVDALLTLVPVRRAHAGRPAALRRARCRAPGRTRGEPGVRRAWDSGDRAASGPAPARSPTPRAENRSF
jgi:sortase A